MFIIILPQQQKHLLLIRLYYYFISSYLSLWLIKEEEYLQVRIYYLLIIVDYNREAAESKKTTVLKINDPNQRGLVANQIKTTRYSKWTLIPLVLLEQMTKLDNIYFEIVVYPCKYEQNTSIIFQFCPLFDDIFKWFILNYHQLVVTPLILVFS